MKYSDEFLSDKYWRCRNRINELKFQVSNPHLKKHSEQWYFNRIDKLESKCKWCLRVSRHQQGLPPREDFF